MLVEFGVFVYLYCGEVYWSIIWCMWFDNMINWVVVILGIVLLISYFDVYVLLFLFFFVGLLIIFFVFLEV